MQSLARRHSACGAASGARGAAAAARARCAAPPAARRPQQQRKRVAAAAQQGGNGSSGDSDLAFVAKGVAFSFAAGAAIKYGSLLTEFPHSPNAAAAVAFVLLPPLAYAALLAAKGSGSS